MSRASLVYIVVVIASVAGLWFILRAGSQLQAPTELGGVWNVGGEDPNVPAHLGETVTIEQSGRFFRLNFQRGLKIDLKLKDEARPDPANGRLLDMLFEGPKWKLAALGSGGDGPLIFKLSGPEKHTFTVTRHVAGEEAGQADGGEGESASLPAAVASGSPTTMASEASAAVATDAEVADAP